MSQKAQTRGAWKCVQTPHARPHIKIWKYWISVWRGWRAQGLYLGKIRCCSSRVKLVKREPRIAMGGIICFPKEGSRNEDQREKSRRYTLALMSKRPVNQFWSVRGIYFPGALSFPTCLPLLGKKTEIHYDQIKWVPKKKVDDSLKCLCSKKYQLGTSIC